MKDESLPARLVLVADKQVVNKMETFTIKAYVINGEQERVPYVEVFIDGASKQTNYYGEASFEMMYGVSGLQKEIVTVPSLGLFEVILTQVNEVS